MNDKVIEALNYFGSGLTDAHSNSFSKVFTVRNPMNDYSARHRAQFYKPEYDFREIQVAQDTDSMLAKSIEKKANKFLLSGWEFVGENPKTVEYIKKRIQQLEFASGKPFKVSMFQTVQDLTRYQNNVWVLVRDEEKSGGKTYKRDGITYQPIAGFFVAPWETLEFKSKRNGDIEAIRQVVPGVPETPRFKAENIIHFYMNRRPGFSVGSPLLFPVLEDILLLRRIEENVEELIESNLFPLFHYKIGTEKYPEKVNQKDGMRESEKIARTLSYMPASGVYISDWRHTIEAIGSEGKALRIDYYLQYFKNRVYAGLGVSPVDFGEGGDSSRSTAQTQSKSLTEAVESVQEAVKTFIDYYLLIPLLLESDFSFDPLTPENIVEIRFGKIDTEEVNQLDNNTAQLFAQNMISHPEARKRLRERPLKEEDEHQLQYHKFPDQKAEAGLEGAKIKAGAAKSTQAKNQHGTKTKKASRVKDHDLDLMMGVLRDDLMEKYLILDKHLSVIDDHELVLTEWSYDFQVRFTSLLKDRFASGSQSVGKSYSCWDYEHHFDHFRELSAQVTAGLVRNLKSKINSLHNTGIGFTTILSISDWRVTDIQENLLKASFEAGKDFAETGTFNLLGNGF